MASMSWMVLIGLAAGALAKLSMPGRDSGGILITILLGIGGALAAGYLARRLGSYREGEQVGLIASVIGSYPSSFAVPAVCFQTTGIKKGWLRV